MLKGSNTVTAHDGDIYHICAISVTGSLIIKGDGTLKATSGVVLDNSSYYTIAISATEDIPLRVARLLPSVVMLTPAAVVYLQTTVTSISKAAQYMPTVHMKMEMLLINQGRQPVDLVLVFTVVPHPVIL